MSSTPPRLAIGGAFAMLLVVLAAPRDASAQAWVPAKGEGAVAVAFQNIIVTRHLAATTRVDAGRIDTNVLLTDLTYGISDKIAVDLALPLVSTKYTGTFPHPGTTIDDGAYHTAFTDLRFALRYNVTRDGVVITPYIGSVLPSHDYAFYGHAAAGQRLREVQLGVYVAKVLERGVPGLFVSGRYGFGFVEKVVDISHNRSLADLEVGYFFSPAFRAFATTHGQYSHGGIDFPAGGLRALPTAYQINHDQIQRVHALGVGGGAAYSITDAFDVFGSFSRDVAGRNGHAVNRGITIGASWSFRHKRTQSDAIVAAAAGADTALAKREGSLLRCICQKSGK
jgi:hypothetical protein